MVLVSQAPLKSKPSFVSVFSLPSDVELSVVLRTPPPTPAQFGPCVLLGPFPRRAGPTAPGRLAEVTKGPFPLHPESENRPAPTLPTAPLTVSACSPNTASAGSLSPPYMVPLRSRVLPGLSFVPLGKGGSGSGGAVGPDPRCSGELIEAHSFPYMSSLMQ